MSRPVVRRLLVGALATTVVAVLGATAPAEGTGTTTQARTQARAKASTVVTPGDFTGYGFDQCLAPTQKAMNTWLQSSPFLAVGIYISGDSRACRSQPNLTPRWIRTQLQKGWRLLPITLGPQASCQPRFPRYGDDVTIKPRPGANGKYSKARAMGRAEAKKTVGVAADLGIAAGSTLWYDLEGYDNNNTRCRESALAFLSGWTWQIRELGYLSGVYSSAGSGILALDNARVNRPDVYTMPDQIWVARWDGRANTSTSYLRSDGWMPHARIKQYQGGHDETWGGVTINIDRNFLDVGRGSVADPETYCGGVRIGYGVYERLQPASGDYHPAKPKVKALQCLLQQEDLYTGPISGRYTKATIAGINSWQTQHRLKVQSVWTPRNWVSLLSEGADRPVLKYGSAGSAVRRVQRALKATAVSDAKMPIDGVFGAETTTMVKAWQRKVKLPVTGVVGYESWAALEAGKR
ncbi:glycoside hydrolase domain-containing protein [Nocardioides mangrovi]|uniref:DUF1906 domain-containing protein n=1 Tax=Nocardioides mangrovi TaxID=2874580 RepID=A0ABS7UBX8_9ACTN|nr:glycoside hydrolase domain-containing protein [Nocardioides mangrovi]MBZ5738344.1 DUF1906 domain-containing protein [Nocardioides mangrovi]